MRVRKDEKTLLLRFDLSRKIDREIWEWLHDKSEDQSRSMNAFLIDGLKKLMAQEANEKPLDAHALAEEVCREMRMPAIQEFREARAGFRKKEKGRKAGFRKSRNLQIQEGHGKNTGISEIEKRKNTGISQKRYRKLF